MLVSVYFETIVLSFRTCPDKQKNHWFRIYRNLQENVVYVVQSYFYIALTSTHKSPLLAYIVIIKVGIKPCPPKCQYYLK